MARGNQVFKPNWALLAIAPINKGITIKVIKLEFIWEAVLNIDAKDIEPKIKNIR